MGERLQLVCFVASGLLFALAILVFGVHYCYWNSVQQALDRIKGQDKGPALAAVAFKLLGFGFMLSAVAWVIGGAP